VGGDSPYNNTAGLSIGGGILHLHPTSSGGAEIWTTARYGPGYYEVRAQSDPQDWDDIWTIQQNHVDCQPLSAGAEVDLLENIGGGPSANVHWSGYGSCPQSSSNTAPSATDGFHIWGMLWDASSGYTFYRDGTQFWNLGGPVNGGSNPGILILQAFNNACHACASPTGLLVDWARIYTHN
jgi:hypothetical protein